MSAATQDKQATPQTNQQSTQKPVEQPKPTVELPKVTEQKPVEQKQEEQKPAATPAARPERASMVGTGSMDEESGIVVHEKRDAQIRLTLNKYQGKDYLHLREYYEDNDGNFKPTKKGAAVNTDNVEGLQIMVDEINKIIAKRRK